MEVTQPPFVPGHGKARPYEGGINVPMIVAGPAVVSGGREVGALASTVDLFATIAELAGVDARATVPPWFELDSVSMVPYLRDPAQAPLRQTVFAEIFLGRTYAQMVTNGQTAIRDSRYKLIRFDSELFPPFNPMRREELFDLAQDPWEQSNLLPGPLTPQQQTAYQALGSSMDGLRSPRALEQVFGTAQCEGSNGNPRIALTGKPCIGQSYSVALRNGPPNGTALLCVGRSSTAWGSLALPLDLTPWGAGPGCSLQVSGDAFSPTTTDAFGAAAVAIRLAPLALAGRHVYHTWAMRDPAAPGNPLGVTTSDAAVVRIGL